MAEGGRFIPVSSLSRPVTGVNFSHIASAVNRESAAMLPVTPDALRNSYAAGMSTVIIDTEHGDRPVGHVRFSPLLTPELRAQLQLSNDIPELWEIGTGMIDGSDHYRNQGLYRMLRNAHVSRFVDELTSGNLVSIGTTKSLKVLHTLHHAQEEFGVEGIILPHTAMPFTAAFTCVCTGAFGCGFQSGVDACPQRIKPEQFPGVQFIDHTNLSAIEQIRDLNGGSGKIPCTMYLQGNKQAIMKMEMRLQEQFGTPENLVESLRSPQTDYYGEIGKSN